MNKIYQKLYINIISINYNFFYIEKHIAFVFIHQAIKS